MSDTSQLQKLYEQTSFFQEDEPPTWDGLRPPDEEGYISVPQGSHLGQTLIALDDTYEESGADCLFIQELIRQFMETVK